MIDATSPGTPSRTILLTGVTGFLGKVTLEELLRRRDAFALDRVYVLIRPRSSRGAEERFARDVASAECFSRLPPDWQKRVTVIEGDLEAADLGISAATRADLAQRVTHVVHAAGSVHFDRPLAEAARSNIEGTLNLLEVARGFERLERFIYTSTAYVTPHPGEGVPIEECLAPLPESAATLLRVILDGRVGAEDLLAATGHPNTYTLTKSMAEHLLVERCGTVPLTILRPSVISASWQHPFPGWIDSPTGFAVFVIQLGLGHFRVVAGTHEARLDLIPVDEVASRILETCWEGPDATPGVIIRHVVTGTTKSPSIINCWEGISGFFRIHRVDRRPVLKYLGHKTWRFAILELIHHRLTLGMTGFRNRVDRRRARQALTRLTYTNRVFPYFTSNSFSFRSTLTPDEGREKFEYIRTVCQGVYRHLLKRDDTQWVLAGREHSGHGSDLTWSLRQPHGNAWIRLGSWIVTKVLRWTVARVTVDLPSFESARQAAADGSPIAVVPNHRSYLDFVLCSYLAFARPDLRIPIPYIAATLEFGKLPILGRILTFLHAFYLRRGIGREDPELTRRVHTLLGEGKALEFFVEGQRSRTREYLPPKRGLLRCLQSTGTTCTLLPITFTYDRVPEEAIFARELSGEPKPKMKLGPLFKWMFRAWRGKVALGRIHIACGDPIRLEPTGDVHAIGDAVIDRLKGASVTTTYHLRAFLHDHRLNGINPEWLRDQIEERGGRVLESELAVPPDLDPLIARSMGHQFAHLFEQDGSPDPLVQRFRETLFESQESAG